MSTDTRTPATALARRLSELSRHQHCTVTSISGLTLHRWEQPTEPTSYMLAPSICLIGQGKKRVFLGEDVFTYDSERFLITAIELPLVAQIIEASPDAPYLGLTLNLDLQVIAEMIVSGQIPEQDDQSQALGIAVSTASESLIDALDRLLALQQTPEDIPVMAPLIKKEIYYRLLSGEQGQRLRRIVSGGSHGHQIARAVDWLKEHFTQPVRIEDLASSVGLSVSAFHHHFRNVTAMSPLQFQKRMRLNEARRLMLTQQLDASSAAFEVGYESPSQFSREYSRQFGSPPLKDIRNLMAAGIAG